MDPNHPINRAELIASIEAGYIYKYLFFWGHTTHAGEVDKACLSQWFPSPFTVDGRKYLTAEHWMMAEKARLFEDHEARTQILGVEAPADAKRLGRRVRNFDDATWSSHRMAVVVAGSEHKFQQNPALRDFLLRTGDRVLVEASPRDRIWGIGLGAKNERAAQPQLWRGENLLGFALMQARTRLRSGHCA